MDRRSFLAIPRKTAPKPAPQQISRALGGGLAPYTGVWTSTEVIHLLKRTMFGAARADVNYFLTRTMSQSVDELLNPTALLPSPPVKEYNGTDSAIASGATWVGDASTDGTVNNQRRASFKKWYFGVMLNQDRSIREKLTLFWHNHFATESTEINDAQLLYKHHTLLRSSALGNFKTLVKNVTLDPAMLRYLNGYLNTNTAPDENYSRELQELFTLGKENNPNYTEQDVLAAAKVLTGWRINQATSSSYFDNNRHDKTNKQFSSFFGNTIITGRNGATAGDDELNDLLTMIFNKRTEVSVFIVKKLYRWFCYYSIDADSQANVIEPLAQQLRDGNWEIKPVLSTLLKSEHFYNAMSRGCVIKSPIELTVMLCREFGVVFPDASSFDDAYGMWEFLRAQSNIMNQSIADPPSVSGWPSYYQEPQFYELWINADTLPKRNRFTDMLITTGYTRSGKTLRIDPVAFVKTLSNPADPNKLIDDSLEIIFRVPLSDTSKQIIKKQILLTGQDSDHYWTNAWNIYIASPTDAMAYQTVFQRLRDLYKYFMNLAEYQLA